MFSKKYLLKLKFRSNHILWRATFAYMSLFIWAGSEANNPSRAVKSVT